MGIILLIIYLQTNMFINKVDLFIYYYIFLGQVHR